MKPSNWLKGVVKSVLSGDTVVIMGKQQDGRPPEKQISLSSVKAPRLGRRDSTNRDEAFAWQAKEFLRKAAIGQSCVFRTEFQVEQLNNREFGTVFIGSENLALTMIENGMAKVNRQGTDRAYNFEELEQAEQRAQSKKLGLWTEDAATKEQAIRTLPQEPLKASELVEKCGKGGEIQGIVDHVINGSLLRVILLPDFQTILVSVAGVQSPSTNKRTADGTAAAEPYGLRARFFTECAVLNRDVKFVVQDVDRYENVAAVVHYTQENEEKDLGKELIKASLARTVESSLTLMIGGAQEMHALERVAKEAKTGIWTNYVAPASNSAKLSNKFVGEVLEVTSGDCIIVLDEASNVEQRIQFSSIRAPRMGTKERQPDNWAQEAKEFLRKSLIGKKVYVQMEYNRKIPFVNEERVLMFGNVTFKNDRGEDINIAEKIVENGLASVTKHRTDEERSQIYDRLQLAEDSAKGAKVNMHNGKEPPVYRVNDISTNPKRSKERFEALKRTGKIRGIVDFVMSGHRLKVMIGKEHLVIAFALSGIKAPVRAQPARGVQKEVQAEPFAEESLKFSRRHVLQREVIIQIEACDNRGTFLGSLIVPEPRPFDLGLALIQEGLAKLHSSFHESRPGGRNLLQAEDAARQKKLRVWENYVPEAVEPEDENGASSTGRRRDSPPIKVVVSHIDDGRTFYIQKTSESKVPMITDQLKNLTLSSRQPSTILPGKGSHCFGQFTQDNEWYRGYVTSVQQKTCEVYFIDFGNSETLPAERVLPMDSEFASTASQAFPCELAYIKVPPIEDDIGYEAAKLLDRLAGEGVPCEALIVGRENRQAGGAWGTTKDPKALNPKLSVVLSAEGDDKSVNAHLLEAGFAKLPNLDSIRNQTLKQALLGLKKHEDVARRSHKGLFVHGDPGDTDEEE